MKKVIRLTESDLVNIVKRVIKENEEDKGLPEFMMGPSGLMMSRKYTGKETKDENAYNWALDLFKADFLSYSMMRKNMSRVTPKQNKMFTEIFDDLKKERLRIAKEQGLKDVSKFNELKSYADQAYGKLKEIFSVTEDTSKLLGTGEVSDHDIYDFFNSFFTMKDDWNSIRYEIMRGDDFGILIFETDNEMESHIEFVSCDYFLNDEDSEDVEDVEEKYDCPFLEVDESTNKMLTEKFGQRWKKILIEWFADYTLVKVKKVED